MRLGRFTMTGAIVGMAVGLGSTLISVFQYNPDEVSLGTVIATGIFIGVPVGTMLGAAAGAVWDHFDRRGRAP